MTETARENYLSRIRTLVVDKKFFQATKHIVETFPVYGEAFNGVPLNDVVTGMAVLATDARRFGEVVAMIDDQDVKPHLDEEYVSNRDTFSLLASIW